MRDCPEDRTSTAAYWAARDAALAAAVKADAEYAATASGQSEQRDRRIAALRAMRADSGLTPEATAELARLEDLVAADAARAADAFAAEWTREVTAARRAAWNARVRAGEFGAPGSGRVNWTAVRAAEAAQGWTMDDLRRAIQLHGL